MAEQVIQKHGKIIRLIPSNWVKDPDSCPVVQIASDGQGFYYQTVQNAQSFWAYDVTRLWEVTNGQA